MRAIKKDKYYRDRDSVYEIWDIVCAKCGEVILIYQKDGRGRLKRIYLNRIMAPESLASLQDTVRIVKELKPLQCECGARIGTPMMHREGRLALKLRWGSITKRKHKED